MATPIWDRLHLRFASGVRDAVAVATTAGKNLSVTDRDGYLNAALAKYILLFYNIYQNNPEFLRSAFQSIAKTVQVTSVSGSISLAAVTDYGLFLSLSATDGSPVVRKSQQDFNDIKNDISGEVSATANSRYCLPKDTTISVLPASSASDGTYELSYIIKPASIVENSGTDSPLTDEHFDVILGFALWYYFNDVQEFDIAKVHLQDAYQTAPYPLVKQGA